MRLKLWDSGETSSIIWENVNRLLDLSTHNHMHGELGWSVGYFGKKASSEEVLGIKTHNIKIILSRTEKEKNELLWNIEKDSETKLQEVPRDSPLLQRELT